MANVIRKGPWKPEEDQVLINHVKMYGPRDWSSIRSKGLLLRTGKSCRLRWVNKLRPNLKKCKFTAEEERVVIEMQAQIGNKWATIATQLAGRTDNDVKNFWSSRRKRLARILRTQSPSSSSSSSLPKTNKPTSSSAASIVKRIPILSVQEGEPPSIKQVLTSCSSSYTATTKTLMELTPLMSSLTDHNPSNSEAEATNYPNRSNDFPSISLLPTQTDQKQKLPLFPLETQEPIDRLDSSFFDPFVCTDEPALFDDGDPLPCSFDDSQMEVSDSRPVSAPDCFFDDFPADMFDDIQPLPTSPSAW